MNEDFGSCPTVGQARTTNAPGAVPTGDRTHRCPHWGQGREADAPTEGKNEDFRSCPTAGRTSTTTKPNEGLGTKEHIREAAPHIPQE